MAEYKTPGVYVEEVSANPPIISSVATAIPAFFGHTEKNIYTQFAEGNPILPVRITTMKEYEEAFGGPHIRKYKVDVDANNQLSFGTGTGYANPSVVVPPQYLLYYAVKWFFSNGGGACYIVSLGDYETLLDPDRFTAGLDALARKDEPTLILPGDAIGLSKAGYYGFITAARRQCEALKDRFTVIDVPFSADTSINDDIFDFRNKIGTTDLKYGGAYYPYIQTSMSHAYSEKLVDVGLAGDLPTLESIKPTNAALYSQIKQFLGTTRVVLPPSSGIAGVYAAVDNQRGVWKAPANVSLSNSTSVLANISDYDQENMNVPDVGTPVNAIRFFSGRGILVWGARTLDYTSGDWRYIPVRRLMIMIEESVQKALDKVVFEANDESTWTKVRASINNFLFDLYQRGALVGPTPESAYRIDVGLGVTMTQADILAGKMIVNVGVAPSRPAEFIILQFTQKVSEG